MAKILVVDDEQSLVVLLKSTLGERGHDVTGVGDGAAALALLEGQAFDLVLTDLKMEPVDGMAVIDGVREYAGPGVRLVWLREWQETHATLAPAGYYVAIVRNGADRLFPEASTVHTIGREGAVFTVIKRP